MIKVSNTLWVSEDSIESIELNDSVITIRGFTGCTYLLPQTHENLSNLQSVGLLPGYEEVR